MELSADGIGTLPLQNGETSSVNRADSPGRLQQGGGVVCFCAVIEDSKERIGKTRH